MNTRTIHGDCIEVMPALEPESVDTIITDPPYGYKFMGKDWDHGVPGVKFWREALRVAKPGATLMAFGGTRTHHRLMVAIEDAGWELRDVIMWVYGSGFPKSHDISKGIDKAAGAKREVVWHDPSKYRRDNDNNNTYAAHCGQTGDITAPATPEAQTWDGWGTALKPAWEPIIVAMKPLDGTFAENALKHGVAGLWVDGTRVEGAKGNGVWGSNQVSSQNTFNDSPENKEYRTSKHPDGRWPANLIHDGSDEVTNLFPNSNGQQGRVGPEHGEKNSVNVYGDYGARGGFEPRGDSGSAARFFYCAKASRSERDAGLSPGEQNKHPTVKPLSLMRYLCRITKTPTGGKVLDPFMGSGSTGMGCAYENRDFVGIDKKAEYVRTARLRIEHAKHMARLGLYVTDREAPAPKEKMEALPLFSVAGDD